MKQFVRRHPWLSTGIAAGALAILGAAVVVLGLAPITASSGHWTITAKFLDFAKVRSVSRHASGIEAPPLDDRGLVLRGAAHYEIACATCHGTPGGRVPPMSATMTPPVPQLSRTVARWKPAELFYIVKHGIHFTGMPAWPAQERDDEVWAVVAFLRRMSDMNAEAYRALAYGEAAVDSTGPALAPRTVRNICARCHGLDGWGREPGAFPRLAGQQAEYLYGSLRAFAEHRRLGGMMGVVASALDDRAMRDAAAYYAALAPAPTDPAVAADPGGAVSIQRGETIAMHGIPDRDIPACRQCHGPSTAPMTAGDVPRNAAYPNLAGQHRSYLKEQLTLFQKRHRGGLGFENLMHVFVGRLKPDEIDDVTRYYSAVLTRASVAPTIRATSRSR